MGADGPGMDEVDRAFLASITPPDCLSLGFVAGTVFINPDGQRCWKSYSQLDGPLTEHIGLLELMKLEIIGSTPQTVADLGFRSKEED